MLIQFKKLQKHGWEVKLDAKEGTLVIFPAQPDSRFVDCLRGALDQFSGLDNYQNDIVLEQTVAQVQKFQIMDLID